MSAGNQLLTARNISKAFGKAVIALADVQFDLNRGEIHALLGENGAGKSTLIKVLTGVEAKDRGVIELDGRPINPRSTQEAQNEGISTVYQEVNLCPNLSVAENIYIGREPRNRFGTINWKKINADASELLDKFDLHINVTKNLDHYSVAIQQMVAIARASDIEAKVLILDEPTRGIGVGAKYEIYCIINRLAAEGKSVIMISSELPEILGMSDRIYIMNEGRMVGEVSAAEATQEKIMACILKSDKGE